MRAAISPGRKGRGLHPTRRQPAIPADLGDLYSGTLTTAVKAGLGTVPIPDCEGEEKVVLSFDFATAPIRNKAFANLCRSGIGKPALGKGNL